MYKGTLIAVKDMEESKKFYHDVPGMNVVGDLDANVVCYICSYHTHD